MDVTSQLRIYLTCWVLFWKYTQTWIVGYESLTGGLQPSSHIESVMDHVYTEQEWSFVNII